MWLARDKNGKLFIYIDEPKRASIGFYPSDSNRELPDFIEADAAEVSEEVAELFSEITWEGGPIELIIPKHWVARDQDGTLWMFNEKPYRDPETDDWVGDGYGINEKLFPEVTWENSPKRV